MIFRFNKAQLGRFLEAKLDTLLTNFQKGTDTEIEIIALDFPYKFSVKVDNDISVVVWDGDESDFKFIGVPVDSTKLEPEPESETKTKTETEHGTLEVELPGVDPVELAERTYVLVNDNMRMTPEQRDVYNKKYAELWSKHKKKES